MTWTRIDDDWTDMPVLAELSFEDRWHYLAMIQFCSRTQKYDGILRIADARRCSDHSNPQQAISNLMDRGLVAAEGEGVKVCHIDDHIPPPSVRANSAESKVRMQRHRNHKNGVHKDCLPEHCGNAPKPMEGSNVTGHVTRNTSTVQDGTDTATDTGISLDETTLLTGEAQTVSDSTPSSDDPRACRSCSQGRLTDALMKRGKTSCNDCIRSHRSAA